MPCGDLQVTAFTGRDYNHNHVRNLYPQLPITLMMYVFSRPLFVSFYVDVIAINLTSVPLQFSPTYLPTLSTSTTPSTAR